MMTAPSWSGSSLQKTGSIPSSTCDWWTTQRLCASSLQQVSFAWWRDNPRDSAVAGVTLSTPTDPPRRHAMTFRLACLSLLLAAATAAAGDDPKTDKFWVFVGTYTG